MSKIIDLSTGHWPSILSALAGLSSEQLTDKHQPCPLCGGKDRYRFDDLDGTGSWFCNNCGGKDQTGGAGNGMDMLMRRQNWTFKEAAQRIEQHLGVTPQRPKPPTTGAEHTWKYSDTFYVCRFPGKKIRPLSWDGAKWIWKAPPAPRPLFNLDNLITSTVVVLVVEGEKTAEAAAKLFPKAVVTCWASGCKAINQTDWSILQNRNVILWPDNDDVGRQAMQKLAQKLLQLPVSRVHIVANDPAFPQGWDLADATWTPAEASAYVKANLSPHIQYEPAQPELEPADPEPPESGNSFFSLLGFDGDFYYYQPYESGQVMRLSRSAHTAINLVALAPLRYWEQLAPGPKGGVDWITVASTLFTLSTAQGVYNPDRLRGRGAWWDRGRPVLHLGNRLISDQHVYSDLRQFDSKFVYQRLAELYGPGTATPLTDAEATQVWRVATKFRWEVKASGTLLAGWVALAPICGALQWRPHIWLTASAGSGKSAVLDRFVRVLLADMSLIVAGNTTEAGLRQTLKADALPVVFDEAETNERNDQIRMQNILSLARVASSESHAAMIKGSASGEVTRYTMRSMFMMSSISTALKQGADRSRFAQLTLKNLSEQNGAERSSQWALLEKDLDAYITEEVATRLIARTISLLPVIRKSIAVYSRVAAECFGSQRLGDQYGALMAGAWSLVSSDVATEESARQHITSQTWESFTQTTEETDETRCLQTIFQYQVRVETDEKTYTRTIGELIHIASSLTLDREIQTISAVDVLGRHGLLVEAGPPSVVVISNSAKAIASILAVTPWSHSWGQVLRRLPNAESRGSTRFKGAGAHSRAVALRVTDL
jgi:putative DNA primase/helicase